MTIAADILASNPFSTLATRSGMIPFCFAGRGSLEGLVDCLRHNGWRGQVVGPHGSGKSTLLASLAGAMSDIGRRSVIVRMFQSRGALPAEFGYARARSNAHDHGLVYLIDGFEQLAVTRRWWIRRCVKRQGLVVTTHRRVVGLPVVYRTSVTDEVACEVVARLTSAYGPIVSRQSVTELLAKNGGNLRETLFQLYDWYEVNRGRRVYTASILRNCFFNNSGSFIA